MLDARAIAQQPLVEAGDRIQALVGERGYDGFANLALEDNPPTLVLRWKGPLPEPVQHLVAELTSTLQVVVREARYSRDELLRETRRIMTVNRPSSVKIWSAGPLTDCSGLHVTIDQSTDMAHAKHTITSPMKLEFSVSGPVVLTCLGPDDW